jgi:hypothetical protein
MTCFACDREPLYQCPRCGRPYCDEHGEEVCASCLQPTSGLPSYTLYRGSLLALLVGAALALWLLIQPSGSSEGDTGLRPVIVTPTSAAAVTTQRPAGTQPAGTAPAGTTTPGAAITGTPRPTVTTTPSAAAGEYTVASGDSLSGICASQRPALANADCVERIRTLNNLTADSVLSIGQRLRLP